MSAKLTYAVLPPEIKKIANDSLGIGVLKSLFNYENTYNLMIKISDGVFIGFAIYHYQTTEIAGKRQITGVIDCVCVSAPYRKEGFGTLLTFGILRKMAAYGADRVELMMKQPATGSDRDFEPGVPAIGSGALLDALGFKLIKKYPAYWSEKSEKYGYDCLFCNTKPDQCDGLLYAITERKSSD